MWNRLHARRGLMLRLADCFSKQVASCAVYRSRPEKEGWLGEVEAAHSVLQMAHWHWIFYRSVQLGLTYRA